VHVCNVPSPAATASLAIGKHIVNFILECNESCLIGQSVNNQM
jgi:(S)-2-hydroxyglutarate dehydrogenase